MKIKNVIKIIIAIPLLYVFLTVIQMIIYNFFFSYKNVDLQKSNHLYEKFLIPKIQDNVSFTKAFAKGSEYLEIYNFHDSSDIYMWYINNKYININDIAVKLGFHGRRLKSRNSTYQLIRVGLGPMFDIGNLVTFKFKDSILIKYNESRNVISEFQTTNYYMVNCYFGDFAIGSSIKNSEIILSALGRPKSNLAVFQGKGKILIVWVVARDGFPPIRDNYLKEILKPSLFEKGLN